MSGKQDTMHTDGKGAKAGGEAAKAESLRVAHACSTGQPRGANEKPTESHVGKGINTKFLRGIDFQSVKFPSGKPGPQPGQRQ